MRDDDYVDAVCVVCARMFRWNPDDSPDDVARCDECVVCAHCGGDLTVDQLGDGAKFCSPSCSVCDSRFTPLEDLADPMPWDRECEGICDDVPVSEVSLAMQSKAFADRSGRCHGCGERRSGSLGCSCNDELTTVFAENYDA